MPGLLIGMLFVGGLVAALGSRHIGYSMTIGLAAIVLPISLQPFIDDLRIRYRLTRRRRRSRSSETATRQVVTDGGGRHSTPPSRVDERWEHQMKWRGNRESSNVEDRRSSGGSGGKGIRIGGGRGIGLGTIAIVLIGGWLLGVNPLTLLDMLAGDPTSSVQIEQPPPARGPIDDEMGKFVSVVLADTEDVWKQIFAERGRRYREPRLVLFRGATQTACGEGQAAMGPFYCPADEKVYIDLGFYETMRNRLGAPGDFAQAYVIAHEIGHHVQKLLGISGKVHEARARMSQAAGNDLSVRTELQADCFAGVWANHAHEARQILEQGDIDEAMNAAAQIGDDALQKRSQGYVVPDSFTHGTSQQRVTWFRRGLKDGDFRQCDTFNAQTL